MLHSRVASPKLVKNNQISNGQSSQFSNPISRSKSTTSFAQMMASKLEGYQNHQRNTQMNVHTKESKVRIASAFKNKYQPHQAIGFPKVLPFNSNIKNSHFNLNSNSNSNLRGRLHLGKVVKPGLILDNQARNNPWMPPPPINQNLINKKGLMDMLNMGIIPKNADFTQLLNHRYESNRQQKPIHLNTLIERQKLAQYQAQKNNNNFFPTNPNIQQKQIQTVKNKPTNRQSQQHQPSQNPTPSSEQRIRKKSKRNLSNKKSKKQFILNIPQELIVLQINNQHVVKDEKFLECLKKMRKEGNQVTFSQYIKKVEGFAIKYNLKKFQFKVLLDQTRKMSDTLIKQQILNGRAIGIHLAIRGNLKQRMNQIFKMLIDRFRFKRSLKDILKIEKIKRFFKIKKYYQQMSKKRCDFIKFKLGSFAQKQRRFVQQSLQKKGANERFSVQIHLLSISGSSYQQQMSYYKLECRNNIQLTRIFNQQPQYIILLMTQQQCDISCWTKMLKKLKGYHANIEPVFSNLKNSKIREHNSIYYGLNSKSISRIKKIVGKKQDACIYPSSFNNILFKLCQLLNSKLYSPSFWKPHLQKLLSEQEQQNDKYEEIIRKNMIEIFQKQVRATAQNYIPGSSSTIALQNLSSRTNINISQQRINALSHKNIMKHLIYKIKTKQLNSYKLVAEYFSNKLRIKQNILIQLKCQTPNSVVFQSNIQQRQFYYQVTKIILTNRNVNKWVFKLGTSARFSRGLAFLETDSLKILKQKKKKSELLQSDLEQVTNIMKVILIDKLQIPQSSLHDSNQYLDSFFKLGGYVQALIPQTSAQCVFGTISPRGVFQISGSYTKIYTDQGVNCGAIYPSQNISASHVQQIYKLAQKMHNVHSIFGHVTFQMLVNKKTKSCWIIDVILCLQQYSSLQFIHQRQYSESITITKQVNMLKQKQAKRNKQKLQNEPKFVKKASESGNQCSYQQNDNINTMCLDFLNLPRKIVYVPFIDYNGCTHDDFQTFQDACNRKNLKILNFDEAQGIQFLYLNLKQQRPDVLSLLIFAKNIKKALKHTLDGLNFLVQCGQTTNKFDKKVQRRKCDCLYIYDIIWKFRQIKKSKDTIKQ